MNTNIDIIKLRKALRDYFTSAMFVVSPLALIDLSKVETASDEEIIKIAIDNNFDLNKYLIK